MKSLRGAIGALFAACLLYVSPAQSQHWFTLDAADANDASAAWGKIMEGIYGPYDKGRKCWVYPDRGPRDCMRPHKLLRTLVDGKEQMFVVTANKDDGNGCHACTGRLGIILFELQGDQFRIIANNSLFEEFGSWGTVPAEEAFTLDQIGPSKAGLSIESGYMAQGYTSVQKIVYAKIAQSIVPIVSINTHNDDEGVGKEKATILDLAATFTPDPSKVFYDIELKPTAENNVPVKGDMVMTFDTATMNYLPSPALTEFYNGGQ